MDQALYRYFIYNNPDVQDRKDVTILYVGKDMNTGATEAKKFAFGRRTTHQYEYQRAGQFIQKFKNNRNDFLSDFEKTLVAQMDKKTGFNANRKIKIQDEKSLTSRIKKINTTDFISEYLNDSGFNPGDKSNDKKQLFKQALSNYLLLNRDRLLIALESNDVQTVYGISNELGRLYYSITRSTWNLTNFQFMSFAGQFWKKELIEGGGSVLYNTFLLTPEKQKDILAIVIKDKIMRKSIGYIQQSVGNDNTEFYESILAFAAVTNQSNTYLLMRELGDINRKYLEKFISDQSQITNILKQEVLIGAKNNEIIFYSKQGNTRIDDPPVTGIKNTKTGVILELDNLKDEIFNNLQDKKVQDKLRVNIWDGCEDLIGFKEK